MVVIPKRGIHGYTMVHPITNPIWNVCDFFKMGLPHQYTKTVIHWDS